RKSGGLTDSPSSHPPTVVRTGANSVMRFRNACPADSDVLSSRPAGGAAGLAKSPLSQVPTLSKNGPISGTRFANAWPTESEVVRPGTTVGAGVGPGVGAGV